MNEEGQVLHNAFTKFSMSDGFKVRYPRLWSAMYPKRIQSPATHLNPRHYAANLCAQYHLWMQPSMGLLPHTVGMTVALSMSKYRVPTYFIEPLFAEAVMQTRLPDDFYLKDIKWPMPAMLFVLPDSFVTKYFKFYTPFIGVARISTGTYPRDLTPYPATELEIEHGSPLHVGKDCMMFHYPLLTTHEPPVDYFGNYPLNSPISIIKEGEFTDAAPYEEADFKRRYGIEISLKQTNGPTEEEEQVLQENLNSFAVKLLLALTARPEYIAPERIARPENKNPRKRQEALYHPRMVGTPFRLIRPPSAGESGTGSARKMYFHPGNWTHQVIGKREDFISISDLPRNEKGKVDWEAIPDAVREQFWRSHKLIWIESYLVNAPETATK